MRAYPAMKGGHERYRRLELKQQPVNAVSYWLESAPAAKAHKSFYHGPARLVL